MTRLSSTPHPERPRIAVTMPACPTCGEAMALLTYPRNHDRASVRLYRCTACQVETGHQVEREMA